MKIGSILVLCTGNICRSPVAGHLLKTRLSAQNIRVDTAGTMAMVGSDADPTSLATLSRAGYVLEGHQAKQVRANHLSLSELILVMDRTHRIWLSKNYPQFLGKVFKLGFWDGDADVADPYGRSAEMFEMVFQDMDRFTASWAKRLQKT